MRGATIYLSEMLEEREREHRRRARKAFAGAAVIAALGVASAMHEPPPKIVVRSVVRTVPVNVDRIVTRTETVEKRVVVPAAVALAAPQRTLALRPVEWPRADLAALEASAPVHHLCVTPKRLSLDGAAASDRVTVSNPGETPVRITQIGAVPERSTFVVNAGDCVDRTLQAGERCTIVVTLREAHGETMYLLIANDAGEPDAIRVRSSTAARASPAKRASGP